MYTSIVTLCLFFENSTLSSIQMTSIIFVMVLSRFGISRWIMPALFVAISGSIFWTISNFSCVFALFFLLLRCVLSFLPQAISPRLISSVIRAMLATASFASDVKGTFVEAR